MKYLTTVNRSASSGTTSSSVSPVSSKSARLAAPSAAACISVLVAIRRPFIVIFILVIHPPLPVVSTIHVVSVGSASISVSISVVSSLISAFGAVPLRIAISLVST